MVRQVKVTLYVGFQNRNVPIYTNFENIKEGYVVLYGIHKKRMESALVAMLIGNNKKLFGMISDKKGREIRYVPIPGGRGINSYIKMLEIEEGSPMWLLGNYLQTENMFFVEDCGKKEEFKSPYLLDES